MGAVVFRHTIIHFTLNLCRYDFTLIRTNGKIKKNYQKVKNGGFELDFLNEMLKGEIDLIVIIIN